MFVKSFSLSESVLSIHSLSVLSLMQVSWYCQINITSSICKSTHQVSWCQCETMCVELFKCAPVLQTVSPIMSIIYSNSQEQSHVTDCHIRKVQYLLWNTLAQRQMCYLFSQIGPSFLLEPLEVAVMSGHPVPSLWGSVVQIPTSTVISGCVIYAWFSNSSDIQLQCQSARCCIHQNQLSTETNLSVCVLPSPCFVVMMSRHILHITYTLSVH